MWTGQIIEIQFRPFKWPQLSGCRTFPWTTPPAPPAISSYTNKPSQKLKTTPDCCSIQSGQTALLSTGESQHHQSAVSLFPTYTYPCALSTIFVMFPYFRLASNIDPNFCLSSFDMKVWGVVGSDMIAEWSDLRTEAQDDRCWNKSQEPQWRQLYSIFRRSFM